MDEIKLECDESMADISLLCRGCLVSSGEMKNMSEWGLAEDFHKTTNIEVNNLDGISEMLCVKCEEILVRSCLWITQCRESDLYLKNTLKSNQTHHSNSNTTDKEDGNRNLNENTVSSVLYENRLVVTILAPDTLAKISLSCPYNCSMTYLKKSDLLQHMIKTHQVTLKFIIELRYYCSMEKCAYNVSSGKGKYFTGRKFLNQHCNNVHKEKIPCSVCELSFPTINAYNRHLKTCNFRYECQLCGIQYKSNEKLLVHLLRRHPDLHQQYKKECKAKKRKAHNGSKKVKTDDRFDYCCDSPKRSFATQTLDNIKNDVTLSSWPEKNEETKRDEISTQTVFEDLLSLKSSEDESIFCSETVSLSDIQTQTFPLEFGLSRVNKETITSETQSPDLSLKGTQTCFCLYDSPRSNRLVDSISSSQGMNFTSTETQTADPKTNMTDVFSSFNSTETQTCFDEPHNT